MRGLLAASIVLVAVSCDHPPVLDGGPLDAGVDASRDTGRDGGRDGGRDVPGPDTPRDAGDVTTWTRIGSTLPDWCHLERADHPERIADVQLVWTPCIERDNCLRTPSLGGGDEARWLSISDEHALGTWVDPADRRYLAIVPLDGGPPVVVIRSDPIWQAPGCTAWPGDLGEGRAAFAVVYHQAPEPSEIDGCAYFVSTIADMATISEPTVDDREHYALDFPQELFVSSTALLSEVQPINLLFSVEDGLHIPIFVDADFSAGYGVEQVIGDRVMWTAYGDRAYIARGDANTRGGELYYEQPPWRIPTLWTDGREMQWLAFLDELDTDGSILRRNVELWHGTYEENPADFRPSRVRVMRGWDFPTGGDGIWAMATGIGDPVDLYIEVVDVPDGRLRVYDTPGTLGTAERPLLVTRERIIYPRTSQLFQFDPRLLPYVVE